MRYLIVGAGAVGGYFGARLAAAGSDVTFLVRPPRAQRLRDGGIVISDSAGDRTITPVAVTTADDIAGGWDVVFLAVKGTALQAAIADLAPAFQGETAVLPILNGVDHLDILTERFGATSVIGGVAVVATVANPDGSISQLAPGASIKLGELGGGPSRRTQQIADDFGRAGIASSTSGDIVQDMWEKWLFMASGGASMTLLGGPVGPIVAQQDGVRVVDSIIDEVVNAQTTCGHPPRPDVIAQVRAVLTQHGSGFTTSLYRDFAAGRRTEVEPILGSLLRRLEQSRIATPLIEAATLRLRVYEASLS